MTARLEVRDVVVRYDGTTAVDGVSLDVAPGEILALLGPSGCGKSSLLRAVAGLEPLAVGEVRWDGADLSGVPVHRRRFGLMFQDGQLFAHQDVGGNVAYGLRTQHLARAERADRVAGLLALVGLDGYAERSVSTLSGGERQRVALARSLAPRPRLLLLDEPLSALDRALRERLAADLRTALVATGTTAVFVTHDHDEAFTVADRVAVMDAGRMLQVAAPEELWGAPASRRVAEFLGFQAFVADDDGELAVGPTGLVVRGPHDAIDDLDTFDDRVWTGRVVRTVVRRGRHEVTLDVDLGEGQQRLVALVADGPGRADAHGGPRPVVGDEVLVGIDRRGCAALPGRRAARTPA